MNANNYKALLLDALAELERAVSALRADTIPSTPTPRVRHFQVAPDVVWPTDKKSLMEMGRAEYYFKYDGRSYGFAYDLGRSEAAEVILRCCRYQPRLVLRALRRIQAATAWCLARAEGRKRHAEEIMRQQARVVEALEAEAAMLALKR